jgi:PAS domain-containing protein
LAGQSATVRDFVGGYGTSTDVEALKQTEEKLREDERELRRITDAIPQAIVVQDVAGNSLYANRVTLEYTGLAMEDVVKADFRERIFHPEDILRIPMKWGTDSGGSGAASG